MDLRCANTTVGRLERIVRMLPVEALPPAHLWPGQVAAEAGKTTIAYVDVALRLVRSGAADALGLIGADLMFNRRDIDEFVAIYHDQRHIPIKLLARGNATALSVGAGILFASVGHGSAFDIAGQGRTDPEAVSRSLNFVNGAAPMDRSMAENAA
jgi:4-hydroxy-L-threonine phosphate dehydrogenase PdxA